MENFDDKYKELHKLYQEHQFRRALDRSNQYLHRDDALQREKAILYEQHALNAAAVGEINLAVNDYARMAINAENIHHQQLAYSNYLFMNHYLPQPEEQLRQKHFAYDGFFGQTKQYQHPLPDTFSKKLRIGYLSSDFREHIVTNFSIQLLAAYDRSRYEVYCYSMLAADDQVTKQLRSLVDGWRTLEHLSWDEKARMIYEDEVDILVDLAGHSDGGQGLIVCGYKPAPIQICGIGWFNTTGLKAMDYFLTDQYCCPDGRGDGDFSEQLIRLPHTHFCYTPSERMLYCQRSYQLHHPVVFGSFNNFSKLNESVLLLWLQILDQVPGARLVLKNAHGAREWQERRIKKLALSLGYQERQLEIRPATAGYLDEYMDIDIALDPFPYPGGGTTCEALYMGVPVISLCGQRHGERFGYSLLRNIGLSELAPATKEGYVAVAVALAQDREAIRLLHQNLRLMMQQSPLMDAKGYVADVEAAYERIWQTYVQKAGRSG